MLPNAAAGTWWSLLAVLWWCGTSALATWTCPEIAQQPVVECSCDMPHTLRCSGSPEAMPIIGAKLRATGDPAVSLLDCTVRNVTTLPGPLLLGVALHGLVISSGEIREVHRAAFQGLSAPLQALGLPNNQLVSVPTLALRSLPELDRLDLSCNKMQYVDSDSFKGLQNLSFIELSDNLIARMAPDAFADLPQLRVLRLRGNRLTLRAVAALDALPTVEELELSANALVGPVGPRTLPPMASLGDLQLGHNTLTSVRKDALAGVGNLTALALHHNQIDVLEDDAFSQLSALVRLDLAHNRIVAVSGASLAHLVNLRALDLRHNFLRALTADLVLPLRALRELRLDDNDISIVASDALKNTTVLARLTLADNPLNCDCSLAEFAVWLAGASLPAADRSSPVCATPPSLENGPLANVTVAQLVCGGEDDELDAPVEARVSLEAFRYDGTSVVLAWSVEDAAVPYTCDAIFVYEEAGQAEVLLESDPLRCDSSEAAHPESLNVTVPGSRRLRPGHRYRYCVVLLRRQTSDDLALVLGCSDVLPLVPSGRSAARADVATPAGAAPAVAAIQASLSGDGRLNVVLDVQPPRARCEINVAVLERGVLLAQRRVNCTEPRYTHAGLHAGPYRTCANVIVPTPGGEPAAKPRCVTVFEARRFSTLDVAFAAIFVMLSVAMVALVWGVRKVLLRPKPTTHQCFLPPELDDGQQHNRYVKLQATTKL